MTDSTSLNKQPLQTEYIDSDPRFESISKELSDLRIKERVERLKKQGMSEGDALVHIKYFSLTRKTEDGSIRLFIEPIAVHEEFAKRFPEDYKIYLEKEATRVYARAIDDPLYNLDARLQSLEDKYHPIYEQGSNYRVYGSVEDIKKLADERQKAIDEFISKYPEKAKAYGKYDSILGSALNKPSQTPTPTVSVVEEQIQPNKSQPAPAQENISPPSTTTPTATKIPTQQSPVTKPHRITEILLRGVTELQENPDRMSVVGIPRETYQIIVSKLTGHNNLTTNDDFKIVGEKLSSLSETALQLDGYRTIFQTLRLHAQHTKNKLRLPEGVALSPELQALSANFLPQQVAFATIVLNLPPEFIPHQILQQKLSEQFLTYNFAADKNLGETFKIKLQTATKESGVVIDNKIIENLAQKGLNSVNSLYDKSPDRLTPALGLATTALTILSELTSQPQPEDEDEMSDENIAYISKVTKEADNLTTNLAFGAYLAGAKIVDHFASKTEQPVVEPTSAPNVVGKVLSLVSNFIPALRAGNIIKKLKLGSLLKFFLPGLGGSSQPQGLDTSLRTISIAILALFLVVFLIVLLPIYLLTDVKSTSIVSTSNLNLLTEVPSPTPAICNIPSQIGGDNPPNCIGPSPTPFSQPTISPQTGTVPQGFPVKSSCVTQPPGGPYSHQSLNAVDIGQISTYRAWEIKSTHPGKVLVAGIFGTHGGYGLAVVLESLDKRYITYYGHMRRGSLFVRVGDVVNVETTLGIVNNTGYSTGDHLHYEIRGPRSVNAPWGSQSGPFGNLGTILNYLPNCRTWSCRGYCTN